MGHGAFSGTAKTEWLTEAGPDRQMRIIDEFWYEDPHGKKWITPSKFDVDGASIPAALWSLVGSPYTGDYRRASIVHDKACADATGDPTARRLADRMFFSACLAGGCSWWQAALLYLGVRIGAAIHTVEAWRLGGDAEENLPRLTRTRAEDALEQDFRAAGEDVLRQGKTEDPAIIEKRADLALTRLTGLDFRAL